MTQFQILVLRALFALVCAARHFSIVFKKDVEGRGFATSGNIDRLWVAETELAAALRDTRLRPMLCDEPMEAGPRHCLLPYGHDGQHSCQ